ncbi:MAG TPA: NAD(P)-dependent oxidoreductase [Ohtaekwangia sp.]|nr:NAD(P)-dependent oxidoreductase [Ohtaekwangia sp.]
MRCLVVDPMHESLFPMLREIGWEADYKPSISRDEIRRIAGEYEGLIVRSKTSIDEDLLGAQPRLKFVGRAGAGLDNLDLPYLQEKKIRVLHASEGNRDAVAEYTIGALLSLMRNIPKADREVRNLVWDREGNRGEELMGKTVGIVGCGNMGYAFARRLSGFGCNVLAYDKYKNGFSDQCCREVTMAELAEQADIVSFHIPLTGETRGMVDLDYFSRFKRSIIVLNTARGEILKLSDLLAALESGKVRGACLDVLENEKLNTLSPEQRKVLNSLGERTDVIFTPHIAGWTFESHVKINVALVNKISTL